MAFCALIVDSFDSVLALTHPVYTVVISIWFCSQHSLSLNPTAKEHVRAQQYAKGARQWNQEKEEDQVRFDTRNGPQVFEKPKICQEIQSFQA
jgi:hypothetical protein